jgi:nicotinamide mononucleotide (NMN) deamidase PncC
VVKADMPQIQHFSSESLTASSLTETPQRLNCTEGTNGGLSQARLWHSRRQSSWFDFLS